MSGHKRTTIALDIEQYRRMHDAAQKASHQEKENNLIIQSLREESARLLDSAIQQSRYREEEFLHAIHSLEADVQHLESAHHALLARQADELANYIEQMRTGMETDFTRVFEEREQAILSHIAREKERRQDWENEVEDILQKEQNREDRRYQLAYDWVNAAWVLAEFIDNNLPWQNYYPERFQSMMDELQTANEDLENEFIDAALLQTQQTYRTLSAYRVEVECELLTCQVLLSNAQQQIKELQIRLDSVREVRAIDQNGKELNIPIDVNVWTNGALDEINEKLKHFLRLLESPSNDLKSYEIKRILDSDLAGLSSQLDETIFQARLAVLQSQMRINIADIMLRALIQQGYMLQESEYEGDDQRQGFNARVLNLEGSQIVIEVKPAAGATGSQEVHIHSLDAARKTHHELRQRALEISRGLRQYGLNVGALTTQPETPHPFQRNIRHSVRKEQVWLNP